MAFKKGDKKPKNSGKKKGVPNKSTTLAREAVARFMDKNTGRLEKWLDEIAEDSPKDAFECVMKVMEYHIPKLARTEGTVEHSVDDKLAEILTDMDGRSSGLPKKDNTVT